MRRVPSPAARFLPGVRVRGGVLERAPGGVLRFDSFLAVRCGSMKVPVGVPLPLPLPLHLGGARQRGGCGLLVGWCSIFFLLNFWGSSRSVYIMLSLSWPAAACGGCIVVFCLACAGLHCIAYTCSGLCSISVGLRGIVSPAVALWSSDSGCLMLLFRGSGVDLCPTSCNAAFSLSLSLSHAGARSWLVQIKGDPAGAQRVCSWRGAGTLRSAPPMQ